MRVKIVVYGEGARREFLEMLIWGSALDNVTLLPLLEPTAYQMLPDADVCLITQQRGSGRAFFPSKPLATLALAKPVVTVADEESEPAAPAQREVSESACRSSDLSN